MKTLTLLALAILSSLHVCYAEGDLTKQEPIEINVKLGDHADHLRFYPNHIELETSKLYKLRLHNLSPQKHYFSSDMFSRSIFTRKAQVVDHSGNTLAEIKGSIREIEVYPNAIAEWWFVPVKAGLINDLKCTIKGHAEAGMTGTINIK